MRYRDEEAAVGCWFGEGATSEGDWHEGLNFAAIHKLPVLFVCENNLYAASTHVSTTTRISDIADRAAGYGMPGIVVDGMDVDMRQRRSRAFGLEPLDYEIERIHREAAVVRGERYPWEAAGLEPFSSDRRDWKRRYATIFLKGAAM